MYLIVINNTGAQSPTFRHPHPTTSSVTEIATEQEFKDRVSRLIANGTDFQAYTAQRLAVATNVVITPIEPGVAWAPNGMGGGATTC